MSKSFYTIEPNLNDDRTAYIDDWEFTYWANKPKSEVIKNNDGTFSVIMEKDFIPLVFQLQNLFKDGNTPEDGTYLGEAVLAGSLEPADCIDGDFVQSKQGLFISTKLLEIFKKFKLPNYSFYNVPLKKRKKQYDNYGYIYFENSENSTNLDIQFIKVKNSPLLCVSENLKEAICTSDIKGCKFKEVEKKK